MATVQQRYTEEASKRYRDEGISQFVELKKARGGQIQGPRGRSVGGSCGPEQADTRQGRRATYKFLILGAGFGGLLCAVHLIQQGVATAEEIRLLDAAGGFGGTWYWNRYPGLHCDVESYTYMPLLEETGYVPKSKYASGVELREHAERIAEKWGLSDKVLFRANVEIHQMGGGEATLGRQGHRGKRPL